MNTCSVQSERNTDRSISTLNMGAELRLIEWLLRAEGLHSCPQMAWSVYRRTVQTYA